ncbi:MAG TPA: response regulator [Chloroflexota bacterium]|nr:response regulator [Chloroflexota bacterium]
MMEGRRIVVVGGESDLGDTIRVLEQRGYLVLHAAGAVEAVTTVRTALPDLVVLAVMTPDSDSLTTLREIRAISAVPVIPLSVSGEEDDRVLALRLGADDFVTVPFSQRELLARTESMLRRVREAAFVPAVRLY